MQEYTGIPAHTLVHGQSLYKAAEAEPALKTGNKIKPEDQQTLLSITWIPFFPVPCPSFFFWFLVFLELTCLSPTITLHRLLIFAHPQGEDQVQLAGLRPQDHREAVLSTGDHRGAPPQRWQLHEAAAAAGQRPGHAGGQQAVPVHRGPGGDVQGQG